MTREQMEADLVLHDWYPVRPDGPRTLYGLRNDKLMLVIGGANGTVVRKQWNADYGRKSECSWGEISDGRLRELFLTARYGV